MIWFMSCCADGREGFTTEVGGRVSLSFSLSFVCLCLSFFRMVGAEPRRSFCSFYLPSFYCWTMKLSTRDYIVGVNESFEFCSLLSICSIRSKVYELMRDQSGVCLFYLQPFWFRLALWGSNLPIFLLQQASQPKFSSASYFGSEVWYRQLNSSCPLKFWLHVVHHKL